MADLQSDDVVDRVTAAMRELIDEPVDGRKIAGLEKKLASPTAKIGKLVDLLADADELAAKAYKRSISLAEAERATQVDALAAMRRSVEQHLVAQSISRDEVRRLLRLLQQDLERE